MSAGFTHMHMPPTAESEGIDNKGHSSEGGGNK
jgi:hypothetical protein